MHHSCCLLARQAWRRNALCGGEQLATATVSRKVKCHRKCGHTLATHRSLLLMEAGRVRRLLVRALGWAVPACRREA